MFFNAQHSGFWGLMGFIGFAVGFWMTIDRCCQKNWKTWKNNDV